jgi:conjugal transfer mating pair stabilization protein TraN
MQIRRLISILIMFAILMQNVAAPMLPPMLLMQSANASENNNDKSFDEDECEVTKEKQCIDYGTKTIEGFPVTRCWQYEETSRCVGRENNYCQTFEDNRGCEEQYGKCLEQANVSKICKNFEKKFKCGDKLEENAEIKHVDTEYLVKRDERDLSNCTESDLKNCVIEHEECLEPAETRNINGKDVFKECWKWDRQYYCKQNSFIDECKDLKARCKEKSRECISYDKEKNCEHWDVNFECEEKSTDKVDCIGSKFCLGGVCEDSERFRPNNFGENIGTLIALANMKKEGMEGCECPKDKKENCKTEDIDPKSCKFFKGTEHKCMKVRGQWVTYAIAVASIYMAWTGLSTGVFSALGSGGNFANMGVAAQAKFVGAQAAKVALASMARVDCCSMSGVLAAACGGKAIDLKVKKQQRFCVKVGRYKKKLGLIVVTSYCCFKSKLMRVIQEQGRKQLGISFGTAKNPDCRGLNLEEIQRINWDKIDWSEVIKDFKDEAENSTKENFDESKFKDKAAELQVEYKKRGKEFLQKRGESLVSDDKATNAFVERKIKNFYRIEE